MKKAVIAIIVIIVIILLAMWVRKGSVNQTADADTSFENDAAAILASGVTDAQKVANLNANLQARMAARAARAAKNGTATRTLPISGSTAR